MEVSQQPAPPASPQPLPRSASQRVFVFVGRSVIGGLAILAALELVFWAASSFGHWLSPEPLQPEVSPAYAGASWVREFYREEYSVDLRYTYVPFRESGEAPWHGKYINVDNHPTGVWRRTIDLAEGECPKPKTTAWVFGGSTVFGSGSPDWGTIPSYLSRSLNRDGRACADVTNFGVQGYVTTQELILLMEQLKRGGKPDIVIFYDGFNDANTGMRSGDPWNTYVGLDDIKARAEGSIRGRFDFVRRTHTGQILLAARRLLARHGGSLNADELRSKATAVVDNYEANLKIASALGKSYNFRFYGFWQPMLHYGHKPMVPFEQKIVQADAANGSRWYAPPAIAAYQEAERRDPKAVVYFYMGDVFDSVSEPTYVDEVHLAPRGNELVADAIAKYVEDHPGGMEFPRH
jgi:lysophospholipase L1-like esterase